MVDFAVRRDEQGWLWSGVTSLFLIILLLSGGTSLPSPFVLNLQTLLGVALGLAAVARLIILGFPNRFAIVGTFIVLAIILIFAFQLMPLPEGFLTQTFAGKIVAQNQQALGQALLHPTLSLAPSETLRAGIALVPASALFLAVLTVKANRLVLPVSIIILAAFCGVTLALLQKFLPHLDSIDFYGTSGAISVGTFSNRNFFAAQLYCTIPLLAGLATWLRMKLQLSGALVAIFATVYIGFILAGLSLSASRSGILLVIPALVFAVAIAGTGLSAASNGLRQSLFGIIAVLVGLLIIGNASVLGILRLLERDPLEDYRAVIASISWAAAQSTYTWGTGFGSFVPIYQLFETPQSVLSSYVNHAHNDWLELIIEGGIPAAVVLIVSVLTYLITLLRVWRYGQGAKTALFQRAAGFVPLLLMLHSFVDYPLRTPALMCLFAFSLASMMVAPSRDTSLKTAGNSTTPRRDFDWQPGREQSQTNTPRPFQPNRKVFEKRADLKKPD